MNVDYEKAVLCAALESKRLFLELLPRLAPQDFQDRRNRSLWRGLQSLHKDGGRADSIRVKGLIDSGKVECDLEYVKELRRYVSEVLGSHTLADAPAWAAEVQKQARLRRLQEGLSGALRQSEHDGATAEGLASDVLSAVMSLDRREDLGGFAPLSDGFDEYWQELEAMLEGRPSQDMLPTGFTKLDEVLGGGLSKGDLTIIGARTGMFKTTLALRIAQNVAERLLIEGQGCVGFASLEMPKRQIENRLVSSNAMVDYSMMIRGELSMAKRPRENRRVRRVREKVRRLFDYWQLYDGRATSEFLRYQTLLMMMREDIRLLVIDFAELVADEGYGEYERVKGIVHAARDLARERNIPVVLLSQLNRRVEEDLSRMPETSHLTMYGEQVAATVLLLYYPYKYEERGERIHVPRTLTYQRVEESDTRDEQDRKALANKGRLFVKVGKSRFGADAIVRLNVVPEWYFITDYDPDSEIGGVVQMLRRKNRETEEDF